MKTIDKQQHKELISLLNKLLETIQELKKHVNSYLLIQNENEAREWKLFLCEHIDKEELMSLENEISNQFFFKFDVEILESDYDLQRIHLMREFLMKMNSYIK